ncbi:hypothetical protein [Nocardia wallacei]|uniref:hypothetical protein n=1 Tax=Nocardia wallacei TaxID=480035 RepID=UPI0024562D2F|nr:hypothetical protein [Nocardia wallacei]
MAQPTPWGSSGTSPDPPEPPGRTKRAAYRRPDLTPYLAAARENWGYVTAAVAGLIILILLFQPWLTASGPDGRASTNAFGRIDATTAYLTAWSSDHNPIAKITGLWAIMAAAAIVVTCVTAVLSLRLRTELASRVAAISAVAAAFFIILTLVYINSKAPELKAMTARKYDAGGQLGSLMAWAFGNGTLAIPGIARKPYSSAGLTPWGMVAGGLSLVAAVAAVTQWLIDHPASRMRIRLRLRSPIVATTAPTGAASSPGVATSESGVAAGPSEQATSPTEQATGSSEKSASPAEKAGDAGTSGDSGKAD